MQRICQLHASFTRLRSSSLNEHASAIHSQQTWLSRGLPFRDIFDYVPSTFSRCYCSPIQPPVLLPIAADKEQTESTHIVDFMLHPRIYIHMYTVDNKVTDKWARSCFKCCRDRFLLLPVVKAWS